MDHMVRTDVGAILEELLSVGSLWNQFVKNSIQWEGLHVGAGEESDRKGVVETKF